MRGLLLTLAGCGAAAISVDTAVAQAQVQRLRDACIATDMNREAFERAFADSGFEPLIRVVRSGQPGPSDWMSGFEDQGVQIVMEGRPASVDATDCGVLDPRPAEGWRTAVERLAQDLRMAPVASEEIPGALEAQSWSAGGTRPLTLHFEVYRQAVIVRFARPPVGGH
ncbi:hypothetical protein [uncultured Brevundimonas sp.]|uniref:hypothetical protein n=1 Tax=uncultured Brevundimonas sp. TaxID=213418 RepID=UPI0030ED1546|tara:strand:- start:51515 stop:52018 length:504 start_codon:yes stop_codon:yes gene_type:complete